MLLTFELLCLGINADLRDVMIIKLGYKLNVSEIIAMEQNNEFIITKSCLRHGIARSYPQTVYQRLTSQLSLMLGGYLLILAFFSWSSWGLLDQMRYWVALCRRRAFIWSFTMQVWGEHLSWVLWSWVWGKHLSEVVQIVCETVIAAHPLTCRSS